MLIRKLLAALIFGAIGIGLFIGGRYVLNNPTIPAEYVGETKAVITQIDTFTSTDLQGKKEENHQVTVSFALNGTEYGGLLNEYNSSMRQGKEIDLIYDIRDPSVYETPGRNKMLAYILMGMGVVFFLSGAASPFAKFRVSSRRGFGMMR